MAGGLAADIAVRVVADIVDDVFADIRITYVAVFTGADAHTAIAVAFVNLVFVFIVAAEVALIILFVFVFVILPHIVAIAEALDDQTIAIAAAVKLTAPTCCSE